jgi:hypothetical protein
VFAFRGAALLRAAPERSDACADPEQAYRAAGRWIEFQIVANRRRITALKELPTVGCVLLAIEVVLWTIAVASGGRGRSTRSSRLVEADLDVLLLDALLGLGR